MPMLRWICFASLVSLCSVGSLAAEDTLTLLEGQQVTATLAGIDADGNITGQGVPEGLTLDGLRKIETKATAETNAKPAVVLDLIDGGRINAKSITIDNEQFEVTWPLGEPLHFPIDVVRAVRLKPGETSENFDAALAKPSAENKVNHYVAIGTKQKNFRLVFFTTPMPIAVG